MHLSIYACSYVGMEWFSNNIFLGVGKTTLTKKLCSLLGSKGLKTSGFYTEEIRNNKVREGFDVVTFDGVRGRLAREKSLLDCPVKYNVGKYGVLVEEFQDIALHSLINTTEPQLMVIDEIGKMEFFSQAFKSRIRSIFSENTNDIVLATVPLKTTDQLITSIKNNKFSKVWTVTRENRNTIHNEILQDICSTLNLA